ncbi:MAG: response regulator, partial [Oscillospiraceae bacterium]|nr:response regulator [Oscillospiraceae bacterium]
NREAGKPYDLVLLEWKMPYLDGLGTDRLIRQRYGKHIPILFFTAYDWKEIEQEAMEVGVEHFLPKPFFLYSFKSAIDRIRGNKKDDGKSLEASDSVVDGLHVLVVDDVEVNRMILVKILTSLGAACDTAENGQDAVDRFTASEPGGYDLILMDVRMPVLNGHEATRAIRHSERSDAHDIAIIAMTANAFVDDVRDALDAGMDAHVSKPIVLDQLKETIGGVLARKARE